MWGDMRIPRDKTLAEWIRELIQTGKLYLFYKSPEWISLRAEVLSDAHFECAGCLRKSPAKYTRATTVHHKREVKSYPELALTRYIIEEGKIVELIEADCDRCHNVEHERFKGTKPAPQLNEERW